MALRTGQNRFTVLSSDPSEEDSTIIIADDTLPPSDPPEYDSDSSESESGFRTPIRQMPSLLPLLSQGHGDSSPGQSSPTPQQPRRIFRRPHSSSLPPMDSPRIPVDVSSPLKASDDSIFSSGAERRVLNERAQAKRQQTLVANRLQKFGGFDACIVGEGHPSAFAIFDAFSTTTRQRAQATPEFLKKKELMEGCAALTLLRGASQNNSYAQAVMSTYLAATGGQRQHYSVLALYGFSMGYSSTIAKAFAPKVNVPAAEDGSVDDGIDDNDTISDDDKSHASRDKKQRKKKKKGKKKRIRSPGLLSSLRDACMATNQALAASCKMALVYDNLNLMNRIAEQVLGRKSAQENGTCATLIPLHKAKLEHLLTSELDKSILAARPLTVDDIALDAAETQTFIENMVHTILRIIVKHGGDGFAKWQKELDESQPVSPDTIEVHKTPIHPLPTMEIDESTITGNVEVIEEMAKVLGLRTDEADYLKYIQIIAGDQLTIARQRSILNVRLGHESGAHSWRHIVLMPGLFHAKIADCHGLLETHFGKLNVRSPGSLGFHNTVLDRLPITLTSLPPFRTCRDLIMDSLTTCADSIDSFATLVGYARQIYQAYADVDRVQELRERRIPEERLRDSKAKAAKKAGSEAGDSTKSSLPHIPKGDMVTPDVSLVILRMWAFCYRGNGRTKYAHEMLHLLHNLICVWTKELRYIVLQNWLANPQGKPNSFVEIDLVQEHLNFWIKKIYKADGEGHSWDCWQRESTLTSARRQGSKHASPELAEDIQALMDSLAEHEVYTEKEGRVLDDDEKPVPDVLSVGMAALTHGTSTTPLAEFNEQFEILRRRRQLTPASDLLARVTVPTAKPEIPVDATVDSPMAREFEDSEIANNEEMDEDSEHDTEEEREDEPEEDLFAESPTPHTV
ncbi:hypothetical protein MSAN_00410200 [Mycena sanguinolenta]|uniref:DUF6589 domain-containing protein n=1 Tax=Mycena sanguinolenta TaxID=230812 RepID=A0A8H7DL53_9AGAR|nr:hypothetical protein MSAN_00410200 [Mycena sanguinolenta]